MSDDEILFAPGRYKRENHPACVAARAAGQLRYDPGYPCPKGHTCQRFCSSHACVECSNDRSRIISRELKAANALKPPKPIPFLKHPARLAALAAGKKKFDPGRPCKNGHHSKRYVVSTGCIECHNPKREAAPAPIPLTEHPARLAALAAGKKKFDPGKQCPKGHRAQRYVASMQCIGCIAEKNASVTRKREAALGSCTAATELDKYQLTSKARENSNHLDKLLRKRP